MLRLEFIKERQMKVSSSSSAAAHCVSAALVSADANRAWWFMQTALFGVWVVEFLAFVGLIVGISLKQSRVMADSGRSS